MMSMLFVKPHLIKSLYDAKKGTFTVAPYSHCSAKNDKNITIIFTTNSSNKILGKHCKQVTDGSTSSAIKSTKSDYSHDYRLFTARYRDTTFC